MTPFDAAALARGIVERAVKAGPCDGLREPDLAWLEQEIAAALTAVRDEERARIADWYEETFCPRAGVKGDEKHARGDCEPCNLAAAIRHQEGA